MVGHHFVCRSTTITLNISRNHLFQTSLDFNKKSGAINIIDLANYNSCSFIATDDMGKYINNDEFELIGRVDNSDVRGCNLLV